MCVSRVAVELRDGCERAKKRRIERIFKDSFAVASCQKHLFSQTSWKERKKEGTHPIKMENQWGEIETRLEKWRRKRIKKSLGMKTYSYDSSGCSLAIVDIEMKATWRMGNEFNIKFTTFHFPCRCRCREKYP